MNSIATKLSLAFILVVVLGVASVSLLVRRETAQGFESYLQAGGGMFATRAVSSLEELYGQNGNWNDAQALLQGLVRSSADRLVLVDADGRVIADTAGELVGRTDAGLDSYTHVPVVVGGKSVGTLYLVSFGSGPANGAGRGRGPMGGQGVPGAGPAAVRATSPSLESSFLASVDRAITTTAILAGLVAIVVGLVMARRIVGPLGELSAAAREVAQGRLAHRLKVTSGDELGQVAVAFNTMAESLEQNEQARRRLVADIAHDLRTPLTVIEGTVDGMVDGVFDLDRGNLESVKEEVAILTKLVADLRTLSLAEAGHLKLERVPTDPLELVKRSVSRVEPLAQQKGIECRVEGDASVADVEVDPGRMGQVLGNLLDNALRHTPAGGSVTVMVGSRQDGKAPQSSAPGAGTRGWVSIAVADTGEGVSAENLPHLFDRFYRADASRSRKSGGSGLGLAIVKQLVEAHGGRVWAESEVGKGSRFVVELPATLVARPEPVLG